MQLGYPLGRLLFVRMRNRSLQLPFDGRSPVTLLCSVPSLVSLHVGLSRSVSRREGVDFGYFSLRLAIQHEAVQELRC
jgi:hypothetical protein